jgi:5'-3' exonuclease
VPPELIPDVLALTGDSVDNIPGVEGVGPKTAAKLVLEHGGVAKLLGEISAIKNEKPQFNIRHNKSETIKETPSSRDDSRMRLIHRVVDFHPMYSMYFLLLYCYTVDTWLPGQFIGAVCFLP